jgi:hypothetical protein
MQKVVDLWIKIRNDVALIIYGWLEWLRMKRLRRMEVSRDDWKEKARVRADEIRDFRKARRADRERIQKLADEIRRLDAELKKKN